MPQGFINAQIAELRPRTKSGTFAPFSSSYKDIMQQQAQEFQGDVVAVMQRSYKRPRASTGRLATVTSQPGNRLIAASTWKVGIPSHLNQSQSKYWRTIEQGSAAVWRKPFIGTKIMGTWIPGGGFIAVSRERRLAAIERGDPRVQTVKREIAPMGAYERAWIGGAWSQRTNRSFNQHLGRYFQ